MYRFKNLVCSLSLIMLFGWQVLANDQKAKKSPEAVHNDLIKLEHFSAKMVQKRFSSLRKKFSTPLTGEAQFSQPGFFRWTINESNKEITIFDGKTLVQYYPDEQQAKRFKQKSQLFGEIKKLSQLVLDPSEFMKMYQLIDKSIDTKSKQSTFVLKPKDDGLDIAEIEIKTKASNLDQKNYIASLKIKYRTQNEWHIDFSEPSFKEISRSVYDTNLPGTVKITDIN